MRDSHSVARNRTRLVLNDESAPASVAEVTSLDSRSALQLAARLYPGRAVEIFGNGRSMGRVPNMPDGGYWIVGSDAAKRRAAEGGRKP